MAARASSPSSTERLTFRSPNSASAYRAAPTTSADPRRCANLVFALMFGVGWVCLALFAVENMVGTSEYSWFALNLRVEYAENGAVPLSEDFTFDSIFVALFLLSNGVAFVLGTLVLWSVGSFPAKTLRFSLLITMVTSFTLFIYLLFTSSYVLSCIFLLISVITTSVWWELSPCITFASMMLHVSTDLLFRHATCLLFGLFAVAIGLVLLTPPIEVFVWSLASVYARAFPPFTWFPLLFFSTFFALWTLQVVRAISAFVMAGATSILVLNNCYANTAELSIIWGHLTQAFSSQFGSICLSSLIVGWIEPVEMAMSFSRQKNGLLNNCCFCFNLLLQSVNSWVLYFMALRSGTYCDVAFKAKWIVYSNAMQSIMSSSFLSTFVFCSSFCCAIFCSLFAAVFLLALRRSVSFALVACVFLLSFMIASSLLSFVTSVARTLSLCSAMFPNETRTYLNSYLSTAAGECYLEEVRDFLQQRQQFASDRQLFSLPISASEPSSAERPSRGSSLVGGGYDDNNVTL